MIDDRNSKKPLLNILEHNLLSMMMCDSEPLHMLYGDAMRDVKE
jgi:hypothetical protein